MDIPRPGGGAPATLPQRRYAVQPPPGQDFAALVPPPVNSQRLPPPLGGLAPLPAGPAPVLRAVAGYAAVVAMVPAPKDRP